LRRPGKGCSGEGLSVVVRADVVRAIINPLRTHRKKRSWGLRSVRNPLTQRHIERKDCGEKGEKKEWGLKILCVDRWVPRPPQSSYTPLLAFDYGKGSLHLANNDPVSGEGMSKR